MAVHTMTDKERLEEALKHIKKLNEAFVQDIKVMSKVRTKAMDFYYAETKRMRDDEDVLD